MTTSGTPLELCAKIPPDDIRGLWRRWAYGPSGPRSCAGQQQRDSNTGDNRGNLETQLNNLAGLGPPDEFIHQDVASGRAMPEARRLSTYCI